MGTYLNAVVQKDFTSQLDSYEIGRILDICLDLLQRRCSRHQERVIVSLCGRCGSKAYKVTRQEEGKLPTDVVNHQKKACLVISIVVCRNLKGTKSDHELTNIEPNAKEFLCN